MGCDIHLYLEKKVDNKWEAIKGKNPYYGRWEGQDEFIFSDWLYDGRNYNLFSILAGVRNSYNIKPISEPKGFPEDLSPELRESFWDDGHSQSWYTFKEMLEYDWTQALMNEGFVSEETYKQFKIDGNPYPCCKGVGGGNVEIVLNSEMDRLIKSKYPWEQNKSFYTIIKWESKYSEIAEDFLNNINTYIKENEITNLENYRIVFWFDN